MEDNAWPTFCLSFAVSCERPNVALHHQKRGEQQNLVWFKQTSLTETRSVISVNMDNDPYKGTNLIHLEMLVVQNETMVVSDLRLHQPHW